MQYKPAINEIATAIRPVGAPKGRPTQVRDVPKIVTTKGNAINPTRPARITLEYFKINAPT